MNTNQHNPMCMCETYMTPEELAYTIRRVRELRAPRPEHVQKQKQKQEQKEEVVENPLVSAGWTTVTKKPKNDNKATPVDKTKRYNETKRSEAK